jgi:DNA-nicking Smr family endonuclease
MAQRIRGLGELARLRDELAQRAQAEANRRREEADLRRREAAAASEFRVAVEALGDVKPLAPHGRKHHARPPHPPQPKQRQLDERQVLAQSVSDEIDIESLLDTDESLSYRRPGIGPDVLRKLRRGDWVIQSELDLHGHRVDEAREELAAFLKEAIKRGLRCVRIVHGKGLGSKDRQPVLKGKVRAWLVQRDEVIAFCQARAAEGGSGALVVLLRPSTASAARF